MCLVATGCGEPSGRWSGTEWWGAYAVLPEWVLTPVGGGALDETTQPFPSAHRIAVSSSGRIAVVQNGIPAVWVYDAQGRSLGRAGRSEIMDLRGPNRTRIWAESAGWLSGDRLWIAERGGDVAIFNRELAFSDVWEISATGVPLDVTLDSGRMSALLLDSGETGAELTRVWRSGITLPIASIVAGDTAIACPDASCFVELRALGDTLGYLVARHDLSPDGETREFRLPRAPEGTRATEDGPLPRSVRRLLVDDEDRTWLGLPVDDSGRAYWVILDRGARPIGRFHLTDEQEGLLVRAGVLWTRREVDGVTWLYRYSIAAPEDLPITDG